MIFLVLMVSFILRLIRIDQSFWLDESSQALMSSKSLGYIWFGRDGDFHPPLSYIFSHFWLLVSSNDIWLRMLPVLFGVGSIYILYLLGKKIFDNKVGLIAAILLGINPYHIYYSQEFRMYSQETFFVVFGIYLFWNFLEKKNFRNIIYLGVVNSLILYSHYFGLFFILSLWIYLIIYMRNKLIDFIKSQLVTFVLFLPWIPQLFKQLVNGVNAEQYLPGWSNVLSVSYIKAIPLTFLKFSIGRIDMTNKLEYFFIALFVLLIFFIPIIYALKKIKDKKVGFVVVWLFVPIFLALFVSFWIPLFQPFRLLFILPPYLLLISYGLSLMKYFRKIFLILVVFVSIFSFLIFNLNPRFWREDWKSAVGFINKNVGEQGVVLFAWPQPFAPYEWYKGDNKTLSLVNKFPASEQEINDNFKISGDTNELFLFEYIQDLSDPARLTQKKIRSLGFKEVEKKNFEGVGFIDIYQK